jgi:hypothetical protein
MNRQPFTQSQRLLIIVILGSAMLSACKEKSENQSPKVEDIYDINGTNPTGTGTNPGGAGESPSTPQQGNNPG